MLNSFYYNQKLENLVNSDFKMAIISEVLGHSAHHLLQQTTGNPSSQFENAVHGGLILDWYNNVISVIYHQSLPLLLKNF
jgi:hypothetical protein